MIGAEKRCLSKRLLEAAAAAAANLTTSSEGGDRKELEL